MVKIATKKVKKKVSQLKSKTVSVVVKDLRLRHCVVVFPVSFLAPEDLQKVIDSHSNISNWAWIIHDRDFYTDKDLPPQSKIKKNQKKIGDLKDPHYHIYLKFKDVRTARHIAQWFGVQPQSVEKIKGKLSDALAYLTHQNHPEKFQYSLTDIKANFDVHLSIKNDLGLPLRLVEISELISQHIINRKNYFNYITELEYLKYRTEINRLFQYQDDKFKENFVRNMKCIYIYGGTGLGKTSLAKEIAEKNKYSYYVTASSNDIFNSYAGEQCIIADDLRYHPKFLTFDDLLRILDPHTSSDARSRYFNKFLRCKLFIITTSLPIDKFFLDFKGFLPKEDIDQFRRRCQTYIVMKKSVIEIYAFNEELKQYFLYKKYRNFIYEKYHKIIESKSMAENIKISLGETFHDVEEIKEEDSVSKKPTKKSKLKD